MNIFSILNRFLDGYLMSGYQENDFLLQKKVKILSANTLTAIFITLLLFPMYIYFQVALLTVLPAVLAIIICFVILGLIKYGHISLAGHLLISTILSAAWITLFVDTQPLLMKVDSISYVLGAFTLVSLTVVNNKRVIFVYLALNSIMLYLFFYQITTTYSLETREALEYLLDNLFSLIIISIVCYQVVSINQSALDKAHESIQVAQSEVNKNLELNQSLELMVVKRTAELLKKNEELQQEIKDRQAAETKLREAQEQLINTAHKAGMAEIATDSLHNVGNILNSVKTSAYIIKEAVLNSPMDSFTMTCDMIRSHEEDLIGFVLHDPKGIKVFGFCLKLEQKFKEVFADIEQNIDRLNSKIDTITNVIVAQQNQAGTSSMEQSLNIKQVIEDSLTLLTELQINNDIEIIRNYSDVPLLTLQKTKLIHILVNLFKNAVQAMRHPALLVRTLTIAVFADEKSVVLKIADTGLGISQENIKKIFSHGFTTKKEGYGFGLHSCANYINEMGASIKAESEGEGKGATFYLTFPLPMSH